MARILTTASLKYHGNSINAQLLQGMRWKQNFKATLRLKVFILELKDWIRYKCMALIKKALESEIINNQAKTT